MTESRMRLRSGASGANFELLLGGVVEYSTLFSEISDITFLGSDDDDELIVDFSGGNPIPAGGLNADGSFVGIDTLQIANGSTATVLPTSQTTQSRAH